MWMEFGRQIQAGESLLVAFGAMILMCGVTVDGMWLHEGAFEGMEDSLVSYDSGTFPGECRVLKPLVILVATLQGFAQASASPRNRTFVLYTSLCTFQCFLCQPSVGGSVWLGCLTGACVAVSYTLLHSSNADQRWFRAFKKKKTLRDAYMLIETSSLSIFVLTYSPPCCLSQVQIREFCLRIILPDSVWEFSRCKKWTFMLKRSSIYQDIKCGNKMPLMEKKK